MRFSLLYQFLKQGVKLCRIGFYRKRSVVGIENLPKNKPYILAANHQNAFMDPIMIAVAISWKQTFYLVRADIFKKKLASKVLHALNMMPIYRMRDGADSVEKNKAIFEKCYDILKGGNPIMIFPEGNHSNIKQLRPVKKGIARIAFGAEEKYNFELDLQIVPVGINYSNHTDVGATLQVNFGQPISISDYKELYKKDEAKALMDVRAQVHQKISDLIIDIKPENYNLIEDIRKIFEFELSEKVFDLDKEIAHSKALISALQNKEIKEEIINKLKTLVEEVKQKSQKLNLRLFAVNSKKYNTTNLMLQILILILFSPLFVLGLFVNYIPFQLPSFLVNKMIKDVHFHSSLKMGFALVMFPLFYLILFGVASIFIDDLWIIISFLTLSFFSGFIALNWFYKWRKITQRFKVNSLFKTKEYQELIRVKEDLKSLINQFYKFPLDA